MRERNLIKRISYATLGCLVAAIFGLGCVYFWEVRESNKEIGRPFDRESPVALRKFPYPYKAGLAICSDIDNTETLEELREIQKFLNTGVVTKMGEGVGLEVGNSFLFWEPPGEAISYFLSDEETRRTIREFIKSG